MHAAANLDRLSARLVEPRPGAVLAVFGPTASGKSAVAAELARRLPAELISADAFQKIAGVLAKRSGPLVAVIVSPADLDDAERLLAQVKYEPAIIWSQKIPEPQGNPGDLLMGIGVLSGVLIVLSLLFGFFLGGFRVALARFGLGSARETFTSLHLGKK